MSGDIRISVDAMGGDIGPAVTIHGAALLAKTHQDVAFLFFGQEKIVRPVLSNYPDLHGRYEFRHSDNVVGMEEKPSAALRKGRGSSSMWAVVQAVKDGEADVAVSGGNTGALMAMATICLRPIEGVSRPAIAAIWPTVRTNIVVLDVGATVGSDAQQLVDFSILGAALARAKFDLTEPTVGLLNVGVEEVKGLESVRGAATMLAGASGAGFRYYGFVEGDDIGKGTVDVVVTEGFTGNIALKTAEGTARQVATYVREALSMNWLSRLGAFIASSALKQLRNRMDPRYVNGGVFLGLNGVVVKSHGGTDEIGFQAALSFAYDLAKGELIDKVAVGLQQFRPAAPIEPAEETEQGSHG